MMRRVELLDSAERLRQSRIRDIEGGLWADHDARAREKAIAEVVAVSEARPLKPGMSDFEVRALAQRRADTMPGRIAEIGLCVKEVFMKKLNAIIAAMDARAFTGKVEGDRIAGIISRVCCVDWWTRQLKRAVVRLREKQGRESAEVCARHRQPYVTNDTVRRMLNRDASARAMLEATEIESEDGEVIKLSQAVDASTGSLPIRRGELMTRIKGCEEWSDIADWEGMFTTNTAPSRFHAILHKTGQLNPRWIAAGKPTPKDGQAWLCNTWAKTRSALARRGIMVMGFRVAEPHQDGTPHWHMLVWCKPGMWAAVAAIMAHYWLLDDGDEPGAQEHRFKAKAMHAGGAAGYVAKYISKGIDDAGAVSSEGHYEELPDDRKIVMQQEDMFGGGAARVRMWARSHGIKQFQPLGQPPVSAWRELRRVEEGALGDATDALRECWDASNREGERQACWLVYLERQGGACIGRNYRVHVVKEDRDHNGRYETTVKAVPVGVVDLFDEALNIVPSSRKEWRPRGAWQRDTTARAKAGGATHGAGGQTQGWGHQPSAPWTRVNNCTESAAHRRDGLADPLSREPCEGGSTLENHHHAYDSRDPSRHQGHP